MSAATAVRAAVVAALKVPLVRVELVEVAQPIRVMVAALHATTTATITTFRLVAAVVLAKLDKTLGRVLQVVEVMVLRRRLLVLL
jgi:hypothetical protein